MDPPRGSPLSSPSGHTPPKPHSSLGLQSWHVAAALLCLLTGIMIGTAASSHLYEPPLGDEPGTPFQFISEEIVETEDKELPHGVALKIKAWRLHQTTVSGRFGDPWALLEWAERMLLEAHRWLPYDGEILCKLGILYETVGNLPKAISNQEGCRSLILQMNASASEHQPIQTKGTTKQAPILTLNEVVEQEWWVSNSRLAHVYTRMGKLAEATENIEEALQNKEMKGRDASLYYAALAEILRHQGSVADVAKVFVESQDFSQFSCLMIFSGHYALGLYSYFLASEKLVVESDSVSFTDQLPKKDVPSPAIIDYVYLGKEDQERDSKGGHQNSDGVAGVDQVLPPILLGSLRDSLRPLSPYWSMVDTVKTESISFYREWGFVTSPETYIDMAAGLLWKELAAAFGGDFSVITPSGFEWWGLQEVEAAGYPAGMNGFPGILLSSNEVEHDQTNDEKRAMNPIATGILYLDSIDTGPSIILNNQTTQVVKPKANRFVFWSNANTRHGKLPMFTKQSRTSSKRVATTMYFSFWSEPCSSSAKGNVLGRCAPQLPPGQFLKLKTDGEFGKKYEMTGVEWMNEFILPTKKNAEMLAALSQRTDPSYVMSDGFMTIPPPQNVDSERLIKKANRQLRYLFVKKKHER